MLKFNKRDDGKIYELVKFDRMGSLIEVFWSKEVKLPIGKKGSFRS